MSNKSHECNEKKCSNCGYVVTNDGVIRCPRCFTLLIKLGCNGNCSHCATHK